MVSVSAVVSVSGVASVCRWCISICYGIVIRKALASVGASDSLSDELLHAANDITTAKGTRALKHVSSVEASGVIDIISVRSTELRRCQSCLTLG